MAFSGRWRTTDSFTRTYERRCERAVGMERVRGKGGERKRELRARERGREGETEMGKESDRLTGGGNRPSLYGACSEVYKGLLY